MEPASFGIMASIPAGTRLEKPSFAKIAASGLKPPSAQQTPTIPDITRKHDITSSPQDGNNLVSPSTGPNPSAYTPKQKKLVPLISKEPKEPDVVGTHGPRVSIQNVDFKSPPSRASQAMDATLVPADSDEDATQISASSDSGKPPSLDGKSVASGTTFALDEKESLRPDDSASVKATEDEDVFSPPGSGLPGSRTGSDDGVRAFRDQLREISYMEPPRQAAPPQNYAPLNNAPHGVLYVPPQGSGVGTVPSSTHDNPDQAQGVSFPPDSKLLEALESPKDRIMVLKLEQDIVDFVKDPKESSLNLPQTNAFYRMLAHKLADYYMLGHIFDESNSAVRIFKTPNCRLPPPLTGIATPSTAASTPPPTGPQMKILRRGMDSSGAVIANGSNAPSKTTSENGESGNDDDKRAKALVSREEREARYEAARKRIMGSAKPSESPEESVEKDNSRSSSATGKKAARKKARADSDEDFEARSAYSPYYPTPFTQSGAMPTSYGFPTVVDLHGQQFPPGVYSNHQVPAEYQSFVGASANHWPQQGFQTHESVPGWTQMQHPAYDLARDFQRTMSFQSAQPATQNSTLQSPYNAPYNNQQFGGAPSNWPQQGPYMTSYTSQGGQNYVQAFANRPASSSGQFHDSNPYPYGQLPSQTFPGRPPSKLEHPLPGSYKSKHFNPQSQSFVPGQANGSNLRPYTPQTAPMAPVNHGGGYAMPSPAQRQPPAPAQTGMLASPHAALMAVPARAPNQPMTHPLPQPVFPRQPSPNVPLPPKPEATPPKPADNNNNGPAIVSSTMLTQNQSSIAKWATPASLPAKPPLPSNRYVS